jgi:molecular chaperone GrpE (heat shock protein)
LAFEYLPSDLDPKSDKFINTLKSSYQKAFDDLESQNIKIIVPIIGSDFDSTTMSAISATDDEHKITQIVELGMIIDGQIFKPAAVIC